MARVAANSKNVAFIVDDFVPKVPAFGHTLVLDKLLFLQVESIHFMTEPLVTPAAEYNDIILFRTAARTIA